MICVIVHTTVWSGAKQHRIGSKSVAAFNIWSFSVWYSSGEDAKIAEREDENMDEFEDAHLAECERDLDELEVRRPYEVVESEYFARIHRNYDIEKLKIEHGK